MLAVVLQLRNYLHGIALLRLRWVVFPVNLEFRGEKVTLGRSHLRMVSLQLHLHRCYVALGRVQVVHLLWAGHLLV